MTLAVSPVVEIRFGVGPTFTSGLLLGSAAQGILGTNVLGTSAAQPINVTRQVSSISIRRGRDRAYDNYNASTATITILDQNGDWNPDNVNSPYYGNILPMRQFRVTTNYNGTTYFLFLGYITSFDWKWDKKAQVGYVTLNAEDAFRLLNLTTITNVPGSNAGDLPGVRITQILDEIDWPIQLRDIDTGYVTVQDDTGAERTVLSALQTLEATELGALYMNPNGKLTFRGRYDVATTAAGTPVVFDDDGTDISYQDIEVAMDDQDLANQVSVTRENGTAQVRSNQTSIDTYYVRSLDRSGLIMETDTQADAQANIILGYRKDVKLRIDSITLDLTENSARVAAGLGLNLLDPIVVNRTQPGGSRMSANLTVQGISHDITPERWNMKISTAFPLGTAFVLGNSLYGVLGTSTL